MTAAAEAAAAREAEAEAAAKARAEAQARAAKATNAELAMMTDDELEAYSLGLGIPTRLTARREPPREPRTRPQPPLAGDGPQQRTTPAPRPAPAPPPPQPPAAPPPRAEPPPRVEPSKPSVVDDPPVRNLRRRGRGEGGGGRGGGGGSGCGRLAGRCWHFARRGSQWQVRRAAQGRAGVVQLALAGGHPGEDRRHR